MTSLQALKARNSRSAEVKAELDYPVIDTDIHTNEFSPLLEVMCAEKTGGFNLVNYRHSSGVYHEQETEDLHRRI